MRSIHSGKMEELKVVVGYTGKVVPLPAKLVGKRKAYGFLKWVTKEVESCMNLLGESKLRYIYIYIYVVTYLKCRCGYIYIFQRFEEMKGLGKCFDVSNDLHN